MKHYSRLAAVLLVVAAFAGIGTGAASAATANKTDEAFVAEMPMHHEMAIEMAKMALEQAEHAKIRSTAHKIIRAQKAEIVRLKQIAGQLGVTPASMNDHMAMMEGLETLGLTMKQAGMDMNMGELDGAKPFDRMFIDMMVPHHQGAIRMARAELKRGTDAQLRSIAKGIVAAQAKEIREMNAWRTIWYGSPSPAGGVPKG
ncbi:MAG: DUF305 domain-containing protein [Actinobacteria bacterium]|nr:DUF305 domain-containing protein [Actinomycetota bacterium]